MSGVFVISLDFELMWGVRDHRSLADYGDAVLGVREALPGILQRFRRDGIRATWATVGLLFARNRDEMLAFAPPQHLRPRYAQERLSPYPFLDHGVGQSEQDDPWHFGRSLLDRVAETEGQEIATHTYSHYYCLEPGESLAAFDADLGSAVAIAEEAGHGLRSIVFPRNQMTPDHVSAARSCGIVAYRGNPAHFAYRSRNQGENTSLVRAIRLMDGIAPLVKGLDFPLPVLRGGSVDVPASRFLRPWNRRFPAYSDLHIARIRQEMTAAAKAGRCYHLWWHPHNMGRNTEANLAQLDAVLATFRALRDSHGMKSRSMADLAEAAQPEHG